MPVKFDDKKLRAQLRGIVRRSKDLSKPMKVIAFDMKKNVQSNINKGQNYEGEKWKPSRRAKEQNGQTLRDTGRLYNSFTVESGKNYARTGTNVKYARTLNEGAKKGSFGKVNYTVKSHRRRTRNGTVNVRSHSRSGVAPWGDIPAYKYIGFNKVMVNRYIDIIMDYIVKNKV